MLVSLAILAVLLGLLLYREVEYFTASWRWRHNVLIQVKIAFRILFVLILMVGASVGPVAYILQTLSVIDRHKRTRN